MEHFKLWKNPRSTYPGYFDLLKEGRVYIRKVNAKSQDDRVNKWPRFRMSEYIKWEREHGYRKPKYWVRRPHV